MRSCFVLLISLLLAGAGMAAVIHVPTDQPTIQAGLDAAADFDTVEVADGTYTGDGNRDLDFLGKRILLRSSGGASATTIDCQGSGADPHNAIRFHTGEDTLAIVEGFTITGAWKKLAPPYDFQMAGGIEADGCTPTIRHCIISGNAGAGVVSHLNATPRIYDCTITLNQGHGVRVGWNAGVGSANVVMERCLISKNDSVGIQILYVGNDIVRNCTVVQNGKDGIRYFSDLPVAIEPADGGSYEQMIERCIIAWNGGYAVYSQTLGFPQIPVHCSDVFGNTSGAFYDYNLAGDTSGIFSADPVFCDTAAGNYALRDNSPCGAKLNSCKVQIGAKAVGCLCCAGVTGNVNGRGIVDLNDLSLLIAYLTVGTTGGLCPSEADINKDGIIDLKDLSGLISYLTGMLGFRNFLPCPTV